MCDSYVECVIISPSFVVILGFQVTDSYHVILSNTSLWCSLLGDWTFRSSPHPRKCSLTRLQGPNERKASIHEGVGWSLRSASSNTRTFRDEGYRLRLAEGDEWLPRSTSSETKTFGSEGNRLRPAEGDKRLPRSASSGTKTFGSEGYRLRPAEGDERLLRSTSSKTRTFR